MVEWLDLSGIGPHLARFRQWLDKMPNRKFSKVSAFAKLGRLALILVTLFLAGGPVIGLTSVRSKSGTR